MIPWPAPSLPVVPGSGKPLTLFNASTGRPEEVDASGAVSLYVCGITPYDATHLGHAATYVAFDLVNRTLRDGGREVHYVQNVTDVDDPLLERAKRDGVDWRDLAAAEIALFRDDMTALSVLPPERYAGVVESMPVITESVRALLAKGDAYRLAVPADEGTGDDIYLDLGVVGGLGSISGWSRDEMMAVVADRGGDPDREGKKDPLDPLLWRAERAGEPSWPDETLGAGRPGWHIECTAISMDALTMPLTINAGGSDLIFPHHEMSALQGQALGADPFARLYAYQGMVAYQGEKISKSRGNLVLVSAMRAEGIDPLVIRMVLLDHHYREDWEFQDSMVAAAQVRSETWRAALSGNAAAPAAPVIDAIRTALADDLNAPAALQAVDGWASRTLAGEGDDPDAAGVLARALDSLLGLRF